MPNKETELVSFAGGSYRNGITEFFHDNQVAAYTLPSTNRLKAQFDSLTHTVLSLVTHKVTPHNPPITHRSFLPPRGPGGIRGS